MRTEPAWPSTDELRARIAELDATAPPTPAASDYTAPPEPASTSDRSKNPLRPETFAEIIGQDDAVRMMQRVVETCKERKQRLDHVLNVGPAGTGKSTFSHVIAHELGVDVYEVEAPVSRDTLLELRTVMRDRDILRIEEIHQQAIMERRGKGAGTQPEVLYAIMEDGVMPAGSGLVEFPEITIIGTTTDEGLLPDPFLARFPLRPRLEPYDAEALARMARWNGDKLGLVVTPTAADLFAGAARGTPRIVNNYVKNAQMLAEDVIDLDVAREVLFDLNGVTEDGLTVDMQRMLIFLYTRGKHTNAKGDVTYRASVNTIATAIGKSRDSKAIALRVEPFLIEKGFIQIGQGRILTEAGIERAKELA
jgi:holliday junction DNA helicase RuvB